MKVVSTNTGTPKKYEFQGVTIATSMQREPCHSGIDVRITGVVGDEFASPKIHGTPSAAVYAYSAATFPEWFDRYQQPVGIGSFGENLTVDDLDENDFYAGDEWAVGSVVLRVSGPRYPCNRLNFCFARADAMQIFSNARRPGVYFEVVREGSIRPGDELRLLGRSRRRWSVLKLFDLLTALKKPPYSDETARWLLEAATDTDIPEMFRSRFQKALTS